MTKQNIKMLAENETQIRVRYEDADPMGLLHHAKYLTYFELGRTELFRASGGDYRRMEEDGLFVVVAKAECRYRRPARYDDVITIRTRVTRITEAKIEHEYTALLDEEVLATAKITLAVVNCDGAAQRIPGWLRASRVE